MAVPDFQSLMLPILRITSDGQEHTSSETSDLLARQFSLTESDLRSCLKRVAVN
jgi:restriction system protein